MSEAAVRDVKGDGYACKASDTWVVRRHVHRFPQVALVVPPCPLKKRLFEHAALEKFSTIRTDICTG